MMIDFGCLQLRNAFYFYHIKEYKLGVAKTLQEWVDYLFTFMKGALFIFIIHCCSVLAGPNIRTYIIVLVELLNHLHVSFDFPFVSLDFYIFYDFLC